MHPRIREIIDTCKYHQGTVSEVGTLLPADDCELDEWIAETVRGHDQGGFVYLVFSALHLERKISSRHLADALTLLPDYTTMGCVAWHMQGDDVPEQLLAGLRKGGVGLEMGIGALIVAAAWCEERRAGALPPELITEARIYARMKKLEPEPLGLLFALTQRLNDARMLALLDRYDAIFKSKAVALTSSKALGDSLLDYARGPIFDRVIATPKLEASGYTVRRSVAHIGRNDPCRCGSGKKYKRCCFEKDKERLRLSSEIAGKTCAEVQADLEQHLTPARLEKIEPHEIARIDPLKLAPDLLNIYFKRLGLLGMLDISAAAFEKLGCPDDLCEVWIFTMWMAGRAGRKDIAERLMRVRGDSPPLTEELHPSAQLLLVRDDPAAFLKVLEQLATKAIETKDSTELEKIAFGVLTSPLRALGILVGRSMIPITAKRDAVFLLDQILEARDRLNLSPDDAFSDILDKRFAEEEVSGGGKETEELRLARRKLEAKAGEVRQMKATLDHLRGEIERREKSPRNSVPLPTVRAPVADEKTLHELRDKVDTLKASLKERHDERAALRRKLDQTLTDLESLREKQAQFEEAQPDRESEEYLLHPGEFEGNQPVRLIEFPRKFHETLDRFPRAVSRGAMVMLGRLAAGEPTAFVGVVRLKACPNTSRVRLGSDYRLLFRLLPEALVVVDLINRKDLALRIKTL